MTPTPEMIAMAERIADGICRARNSSIWAVAKDAALTAIMEAKKQCLQLIADLPAGATEDVMHGREDCYRAIEAIFTEPPHIVSNPSATGSI